MALLTINCIPARSANRQLHEPGPRRTWWGQFPQAAVPRYQVRRFDNKPQRTAHRTSHHAHRLLPEVADVAQVARFAYALRCPKLVMNAVNRGLKAASFIWRRHKPYRLRADGWRDHSDILRIPTKLEIRRRHEQQTERRWLYELVRIGAGSFFLCISD